MGAVMNNMQRISERSERKEDDEEFELPKIERDAGAREFYTDDQIINVVKEKVISSIIGDKAESNKSDQEMKRV